MRTYPKAFANLYYEIADNYIQDTNLDYGEQVLYLEHLDGVLKDIKARLKDRIDDVANNKDIMQLISQTAKEYVDNLAADAISLTNMMECMQNDFLAIISKYAQIDLQQTQRKQKGFSFDGLIRDIDSLNEHIIQSKNEAENGELLDIADMADIALDSSYHIQEVLSNFRKELIVDELQKSNADTLTDILKQLDTSVLNEAMQNLHTNSHISSRKQR